ncbi:MAG TPA: hypothetical protein PKH93_08715, partial [Chitinophagales bacterium]|nr:hypothetical protein [Chitinophagales bacterium]
SDLVGYSSDLVGYSSDLVEIAPIGLECCWNILCYSLPILAISQASCVYPREAHAYLREVDEYPRGLQYSQKIPPSRSVPSMGGFCSVKRDEKYHLTRQSNY